MNTIFDIEGGEIRLLIPVSRLDRVQFGGAGADVRLFFDGLIKTIMLNLEPSKREGFANWLSQELSDPRGDGRIRLSLNSGHGITEIMW